MALLQDQATAGYRADHRKSGGRNAGVTPGPERHFHLTSGSPSARGADLLIAEDPYVHRRALILDEPFRLTATFEDLWRP
jgi:hypothetical protein